MRERNGAAYELTDAPPDANTPASLWVPYFAPDEPDTTSRLHANDYICEARPSTTCVKPPASGASSADKENYKRQCYTAKYQELLRFRGTCLQLSSRKITPLTVRESTICTAIDALVANGNTVIPAGLLWGWRVLSSTRRSPKARPIATRNGSRPSCC